MSPAVLRVRTTLVVRKPAKPGGTAEYTGHLVPKGQYPIGGEGGAEWKVTEPIEEADFDLAFYDHEGDEVSVQSVPPDVLLKLGTKVLAWSEALRAAAAGADVEVLT